MAFTKLRLEVDAYQIAFSDRLGTSETLVSTLVTLEHAVLDTWVDVTSQFGTLNPTRIEANKTVQFALNAAISSGQAVGRYRIICVVGTSAGRTLETTVDLLIDE
jgi:hypothetical protein